MAKEETTIPKKKKDLEHCSPTLYFLTAIFFIFQQI